MDILQAGADCYLFRVAPHGFAVPVQYLNLLLDHIRVGASDVAAIGVLGDQFQRDFLAASAYPELGVRLASALWAVYRPVDRVILAFENGLVLGPHFVDDLARLSEHAHTLGYLREAIAICPPLVLVPARPQTADKSA